MCSLPLSHTTPGSSSGGSSRLTRAEKDVLAPFKPTNPRFNGEDDAEGREEETTPPSVEAEQDDIWTGTTWTASYHLGNDRVPKRKQHVLERTDRRRRNPLMGSECNK
ncbi:hypothetical protein PPTG_20666 [Phytophthora nicotianae INRA-310]|uniref:Uncharacterized protein n=2 Tax=Phytophthora nicotianae TaxID=4792 RepID=W2RFV1_PHYN3|nr:hypothetical protein PPTG_20666 [Phytophthora nicotianae INRA-310]ETI57554.1 hypothetical protein F443_00163 [Phytophthora nicotianae P1569]ETN23559.1 hypothetical protein PPTG_20666 [Phytophthora nicotianae INRA-310]